MNKFSGIVIAASMTIGMMASAQTTATSSAATGVAGSGRTSAKSIISNNDLDKDGVVTKAEATKANGGLIRNWSEYDLNKDEKVDLVEATKGLAARQRADDASSQVTVSSIIGNNDLNRDGVVTKAEATRADEGLIRNWVEYDLNKDGKVDAAEVTKVLSDR